MSKEDTLPVDEYALGLQRESSARSARRGASEEQRRSRSRESDPFVRELVEIYRNATAEEDEEQ